MHGRGLALGAAWGYRFGVGGRMLEGQYAGRRPTKFCGGSDRSWQSPGAPLALQLPTAPSVPVSCPVLRGTSLTLLAFTPLPQAHPTSRPMPAQPRPGQRMEPSSSPAHHQAHHQAHHHSLLPEILCTLSCSFPPRPRHFFRSSKLRPVFPTFPSVDSASSFPPPHLPSCPIA